MPVTPQKQAYLYGLAAVLMWSTVASAFKLSLRTLDVFQLLFYAALTSMGALGLVLLVQGKMRLVFMGTRADYGVSLVLGLVNPCAYYLVLFKAYDLLPAQEAQPLNYTWAITLALLSIPLLKQRLTVWDLAGVLLSYAGVLVISTQGKVLDFRFSDPVGVGLALFSTVLWALYWIYNVRDRRDPVVVLFLNFAFGMPVLFVLCRLFSELQVDLNGFSGAVYVGVVEMGITFVLWLTALKKAESTAKVGNLIFLSPFLSLVFIHFLLGERILPATFMGLVLIVAGLAVQQRKSIKITASP